MKTEQVVTLLLWLLIQKKYVCKPKEDTVAYKLYKQIESGEVIAEQIKYVLIK